MKAVQRELGTRAIGQRLESMEWDDEHLGEREREHIERLDHFYVASVNEEGWPYVQFRGGPSGFLKVLGPRTLGFADFRGNRQYISTGNVRANDRVALFLLDQANRRRLKVYARAEVRPIDDDLGDALLDPRYPGRVERAWIFHVEAFDWNCPQHITPRFSAEELRDMGAESVAELLGWGSSAPTLPLGAGCDET